MHHFKFFVSFCARSFKCLDLIKHASSLLLSKVRWHWTTRAECWHLRWFSIRWTLQLSIHKCFESSFIITWSKRSCRSHWSLTCHSLCQSCNMILLTLSKSTLLIQIILVCWKLADELQRTCRFLIRAQQV
jgi:hypothetical protein